MNKNNIVSKISIYWEKILDSLYTEQHGIDWRKDKNFIDTPKRIATSLVHERGIGINSLDKCIELLKKPEAVFESTFRGMIVEGPIFVSSLCPHHFENVSYEVYVGYLPTGKVIGLSKLARVVTLLAQAPIMQEDYTSQLAALFINALDKPEGVGVYVEGQHSCMISRGVRSHNSSVTMTEMKDSFLQLDVKEEFLKLIQLRKMKN